MYCMYKDVGEQVNTSQNNVSLFVCEDTHVYTNLLSADRTSSLDSFLEMARGMGDSR